MRTGIRSRRLLDVKKCPYAVIRSDLIIVDALLINLQTCLMNTSLCQTVLCGSDSVQALAKAIRLELHECETLFE